MRLKYGREHKWMIIFFITNKPFNLRCFRVSHVIVVSQMVPGRRPILFQIWVDFVSKTKLSGHSCELWICEESYPLHSELETLIWAMHCMLAQQKKVLAFATYYFELVKIVFTPTDRPAFSVHLEEFMRSKE